MEDFTRKLITAWRRLDLPFGGENFLVAVSGGADSVSMAVALHDLRTGKKLNHNFHVAHFDHRLRGAESAADSDWVKGLAEQLEFDFCGGQAAIGAIDPTSNLEENSRKARYRFLFETAVKLDCYGILVGHTKNDQAETFLLNLLRGSGITGLGGMREIREGEDDRLKMGEAGTKAVKVIRPLLKWATREDCEQFVKKRGINFRTDPMNDDHGLRRVKIRKELIPQLADYNPDIIGTLARTAEMLRDEEMELEKRWIEKYPHIDTRCRKLKSTVLIGMPLVDLKRLIRHWLLDLRGDLRRIESKHIESIVSLVMSRKSGREVELPGGERIVKHGGEIFFRQT
ncbi:MAG: tRNA lysidine(34) synthetase TilS [Acidobacteria bacterium]|nr:tRNA lysidine(34) synthetase TilS [Acidobacteriota bacterium]